MSVENIFPAELLEDLANSGLSAVDVRARPMTAAEKQTTWTPTGVDGYVLPYFNIKGLPIPFYRVRLFNHDPKYKQPSDSGNYVYFPPKLNDLLPTAKFLLLTEGEKKAAAAVKAGFPCVALGGTDNWRNRVLKIPRGSRVSQGKDGDLVAKLEPGTQAEERNDGLAEGMQDIIDLLLRRNIPLVIVFDTDGGGSKFEVQRAAANLGFELRTRGIPLKNIRQLIMQPNEATKGLQKLGLDDFLVNEHLGTHEFARQLGVVLSARQAFPRHPNPKDFVNKKLQRTHLARSELQALSTSIISDLDAKGVRLFAPDDGALYYFDHDSHRLIKASFGSDEEFTKTPWAIKLYQDYSLGVADQRVITWLATQFTGEAPVNQVRPEKVMTVRGDSFYYQLNDGTVVRVNAKGVQVIHNGSDDILFESSAVDPVESEEFTKAITEIQVKPWECWWYESLKEARIAESEDDKARKLLALLYCVSPWFYRWRGTQLPFEMTLGEPGSGKSTLYELRLSIISGRPALRNAPRDIRDWATSAAATGGLHVTDNVHMTNNNLRQELSDELCRVITEPNPAIEQRKLYSDNTLIRMPIKCVFAITAVRQPFNNADIIQRSIITQLDKGTDIGLRYDADWKGEQLASRGGRAYWLAHQMFFLHKMFKAVQQKWRDNYPAKYRLINVEQLLILAAECYGWDSSWIPDYLEEQRDNKVADTDYALSGLKDFADVIRQTVPADKLREYMFGAADIVSWAEDNEEYKDCAILQSSRSLGKYIQNNKHMVSSIVGMEPAGLRGNRQVFKLRAVSVQ